MAYGWTRKSMKDYGMYLIAGALCIAACSSADNNPSTGTSGVTSGSAGSNTATQPSAAGKTGS
jgi:hypothetical protein